MKKPIIKNIGIFWVLIATIIGCSSVKNIAVNKDIERTLNQSPLFSNQFTGFSLYDLDEDKFITSFNDTKKFTPASNTKILTMYMAMKSFSDSIPGLLYQSFGDSVFVQPNGDPTFLDPRFEEQPVFDFLQSQRSVQIVWPEEEIRKYGHGWAWDDYKFDYQSSRNWWPIYGNQIHIAGVQDSIQIVPAFFKPFVEISMSAKDTIPTVTKGDAIKTNRAVNYNLFQVAIADDTAQINKKIPFESSQELLLALLSDTLSNSFRFVDKELIVTDTVFSQSLDHVLSLMMKVSDNHISEQLLIMSAWKNGFLSIGPFIKQYKPIWLSELSDFVWVDGSGLSRYNLIAPVDIVRLFKKAHDEFGMDRLLNILAVGGESGTIKEWYSAEEPYIFAKTGTLSNNHNLSGFLKTRSGKWLIFSFMNNHYTVPVSDVKLEMQKLLEQIRDAY